MRVPGQSLGAAPAPRTSPQEHCLLRTFLFLRWNQPISCPCVGGANELSTVEVNARNARTAPASAATRKFKFFSRFRDTVFYDPRTNFHVTSRLTRWTTESQFAPATHLNAHSELALPYFDGHYSNLNSRALALHIWRHSHSGLSIKPGHLCFFQLAKNMLHASQ